MSKHTKNGTAFDDAEFQSFILPIRKESTFVSNPESLFIGRSSLKVNLKKAITESEGHGGCFLVGGYRGVGKSLLVDKVVDEYIDEIENRHPIRIQLNVGDSSVLNFRGVLSDCANIVSSHADDYIKKIFESFSITISFSMLIIGIFLYLINYCDFHLEKFISPTNLSLYDGLLVVISVGYLMNVIFFKKFRINKIITNTKIFLRSCLKPESYAKRNFIYFAAFSVAYSAFRLSQESIDYQYQLLLLTLPFQFIFFRSLLELSQWLKLNSDIKTLIERVYCDQVMEASGDYKTPGISIRGGIKLSKSKISDREIEYQFEEIIDRNKNLIKLILIFDELDKLADPEKNKKENGKRDLIESFLGRMKAFLKNKNCTFIFIGDREIVDNYHSESGSKNALYEGIFDQIFYVPSLLSDYSDRRPEVMHSMVMEYVLNVLFNFNLNNNNSVYSPLGYAADPYKKADLDVVSRSGFMQKKYINFIFGLKDAASLEEKIHNLKQLDSLPHFKRARIKAHLSLHSTTKENEILKYENQIRQYKNIQYCLNRFVRFLTIHSWGNYRRLQVLITQFIEVANKENIKRHSTNCAYASEALKIFKNKSKSYIYIDKKEMSRILFAANQYEMIAWEMGTQLNGTDDKLVISTINASTDLIKFHQLPFNRSYLDRTAEGIDIHAEPHLPGAIEDIIERVNYPFIRRINRGLFEYRFLSEYEQEIKYISKSIGAKASNYVFGLSSHEKVRSYYLQQLAQLKSNETNPHSKQATAVTLMIIGDIYQWERSYDKAINYYSDAVAILKTVLRDKDNHDWRHTAAPSFSSHYLLSRTLMKKGLILEIRQNYALAWRLYREAMDVAKESLGEGNEKKPIYAIIRDVYSSGSVRHRDVLVTSALSLVSLYLKSNQKQERDIGIIYSRIHQYNKSIHQHYISDFDKEIMAQSQAVRYFSNSFKSITDEFDKIFSSLIGTNRVKLNFKDAAKFIYMLENQSNVSTPFTSLIVQNMTFWLNAKTIEFFYNRKKEKSDKHLVSPGKVASKDGSNNGNSQLFNSNLGLEEFYHLVDILAKSLIKIGQRTAASNLYLGYTMCYLAYLESLGPVNPNDKVTPNQQKKFEQIKNFLDCFLKKHAVSNQILDHGLFKHQKKSWDFSTPSTDIDKSNLHAIPNNSEEPADGSENSKFKKNFETLIEENNITFWHHSHSKNLNVVMSIWLWFKIDELSQNNSEMKYLENIDLTLVLPQYQKNKAILIWLKGRFYLHMATRPYCSEQIYLTCTVDKTFKNCEEECTNYCINKFEMKKQKLINAILLLYRAYEQNEKTLAAGATPSWPPVYGILFDLLMSICEYKKLWGKGNNAQGKSNKQFLNDLEKSTNSKIPRTYIDAHCIHALLTESLDQLESINNKGSPFYQQLIQHKYFLYDDFRDPTFINEWMFLHIISNGATHYRHKADMLFETFKKEQHAPDPSKSAP